MDEFSVQVCEKGT